ncbi:MAG TPA: hypothetical protein VKE70_30475, partial [Candidatus Solibacter sp.]|nr:hypothetical protein [Candidatus Solibacter sp.]
MPQPDWDSLVAELRDLQARVLRIEQEVGLSVSRAAPSHPQQQAAPAAAQTAAFDSAMLPAVGRALLGLAGAYLLRALTESAVLPCGIGVAIGLLYAMLWLVWAARTPSGERTQTALHALTGALVISPLLFEAAARLHAISIWTAVTLLFAFVIFGLTVSWRKELLIVATFGILAGLGTTGALLITVHDAVPCTFFFLAVAASVEISACLNHWLSERWLTAAAADAGVLLIAWLVTNDRGVPESCVPIPLGAAFAAQAFLLALYLASTIVRTLLRGFTMTWFEIAQSVAAFFICACGGHSFGFGALSIVCSAACYAVAFRLLDRGTHGRNFYTYSTFGIILTVAGSWMVLSSAIVPFVWSALAIGAMWMGARFSRLTLQAHGCVYLLLGVAGSGALQHAAGLLMGSRGLMVHTQWPLWAGVAGAAVCLAIGTDNAPLRIVNGAVAVWLAAG